MANPLPVVKCVILNSGDILMGFYEFNAKTQMHTLYDCKQCVSEISEGKMEVSLADFIPFAKEYNFSFHESKVITIFDAKPQLEINYKVSTGNLDSTLESNALRNGKVRGQK